MADDPYRSARLKLKRGVEHVNALRAYLDGYSGAHIKCEADGDGYVIWTLRISEDPSDTVQAILGDAVHNLRAALDHTAVAAVAANGGNTNGVYFPFAEDASQLDTMIRRKKFDRASSDALALLSSLRPYRGGNAALRAIHDLDVADKHHSLVDFDSMAEQGADIRMGQGLLLGSRFDFRDGQRFLKQNLTPGMSYAPQPVHLIATIAKGQPLGGSEVLPTLASLCELVEGVVEAFAALR